MIERLKTFVAENLSACKILVVGGNVTLHPTGAPQFQIVRALSPRVSRYKNFCGRF